MADFTIKMALIFLGFVAQALALLATPNSPCSSKCIDDDSNTFTIRGQNISCNDVDLRGGAGKKTRECFECLQTSTFGTDEENDQESFLSNLRYATDWCIFSEDNPYRISGPCLVPESCGELEPSIDMGNGSFDTSGIQYCTSDGGSFESEATTCQECLQNMRGNVYLSNWLTALQAGCSRHPSQKALIGLSGSIFSTELVTITATPGNGVSFAKPQSSGLPMGAIIGIAIGGAAVVLAIAAFIFWKCRKRRSGQYTSSPKDKDPKWSSPLGGNVPIPGPYGNYDDKRPNVREVVWGPDDIALVKRQNTDSTASSVDSSPPPSSAHPLTQPAPNFSKPGTISRSRSTRVPTKTEEPAVNARVDRPRIRDPLSMHSPTPSNATNTFDSTNRGSGFGIALSSPAQEPQPSSQPQIVQPSPRPAIFSSPPPPQAQASPRPQPLQQQPAPRQYSPAPQPIQPQQSTPSPRPQSARLLLKPLQTQQVQQQQPRFNTSQPSKPGALALPTYNPAAYAPQNPPSYEAAAYGTASQVQVYTANTIVLPRPNIFAQTPQAQQSRPTSQAHAYQPAQRTKTNNALNIPLKATKSSNFQPFSFVAPGVQARARPGSSATLTGLTAEKIPPPPCPIIAVPNPKARKKSAVLTPVDVAKAMGPNSAGVLNNPLLFRRVESESGSQSAGPSK